MEEHHAVAGISSRNVAGRVGCEIGRAGEEHQVEAECDVEGASEDAEAVTDAAEHVAVGVGADDSDLGRAQDGVRTVKMACRGGGL
jgi:hypothetical protein